MFISYVYRIPILWTVEGRFLGIIPLRMTPLLFIIPPMFRRFQPLFRVQANFMERRERFVYSPNQMEVVMFKLFSIVNIIGIIGYLS